MYERINKWLDEWWIGTHRVEEVYRVVRNSVAAIRKVNLHEVNFHGESTANWIFQKRATKMLISVRKIRYAVVFSVSNMLSQVPRKPFETPLKIRQTPKLHNAVTKKKICPSTRVKRPRWQSASNAGANQRARPVNSDVPSTFFAALQTFTRFSNWNYFRHYSLF